VTFMSGGLLERGEGVGMGRREVIENPFLDPVEMDTAYHGGSSTFGGTRDSRHTSLSSPMRYEIDSGFGRNHKHQSSLSTYSELPLAELEAEPIAAGAKGGEEEGGKHLDIIAAKMALRASLLKVNTDVGHSSYNERIDVVPSYGGDLNQRPSRRRRKGRVMEWFGSVSRNTWIMGVVGLVMFALVVLAVWLFIR